MYLRRTLEPSLRRAAYAGAAAGLATTAAMYLVADLAGIQPLPQLLQQPLLASMPGPVFGFLIDTLQHAGKVVEEAGLIAGMACGFAVLGAAAAWAKRRFGLPYAETVAAAAGWLVITGVALPLGGQGILGLAGGPTQPIVWLVLMLVWSLLLQGLQQERGAAAEPGRRRLLALVPAGVGAAGVALIGLKLGPGWFQAVFKPPEGGASGLSPELTPPQRFYYVSKNFQDPAVSTEGWSLRVHGLVNHPLTLDYAALKALPPAEEVVTLECISNTVGGALISTARFTGVPLKDLLDKAGVRAGAAGVNFTAADGYTESLPLDLVQASPEILVAYLLDGAPLASGHGYPARILIPGHYGMKGPKWLQSIELAAQEKGGYWEGQGWDRMAVVRTTSRIDTPGDGATVRQGSVLVGGVAFAGKRGISEVQLSTDGSAHWQSVEARTPLSPFTWVIWQTMWQPPAEGAYKLAVRARDGSGAWQPAGPALSFPSGAAGYHAIQVNVSGQTEAPPPSNGRP